MSGHTPGPWVQDPTGDIGWYLIGTSDVAVAEVFLDNVPVRVRRANARLIAAAPELLEALKAQERTSRGHFAEACGRLNDPAPCPDYCTQARAAIVKAEGK